ncbi:metallophosphoesterase family protein [Lacticaseibacillus mingshuiensis]|uniref:Metallophosphoesterase family protein n=1 Tax=Lacticaseibacillus mingshuiensis TaxID=2799574 RepID=A0ABW4CIY4_9LACO|nr:metallophosphoesterase family protein [Lacticaseibacillus mingshuiensis]
MERRIAVFSDTHGNVTATKAVLADAMAHQATDYWFLGDLLLPGPGAGDLYALVETVAPTVWLNGNWEQALYAMADKHIDLDNPGSVYIAALSAYVLQKLTPTQLLLMRNHPYELTKKVNGVTIGLTHNSRFSTEGRMLYPAGHQADFDGLFGGDQDIAIYGHTHQQLMRTSRKGQLVLNPGAAGQPYSPWSKLFADQRAHYLMLTISASGLVDVDFRKIAYDIEAELALAKTRGLPYLDLYTYLRHTGKTVTHDLERLAQVNAAGNYRALVKDYYGL